MDSVFLASESLHMFVEELAAEMGFTRPTPVLASLIDNDRKRRDGEVK